MNDLVPEGPPSSKSVTLRRDGRELRVRGKLKRALDLMTWGTPEGKAVEWDQAARDVGLTVRALRMALERGHVITYLREQKRAFRSAISAANPLALKDVRDNSANGLARVRAVQVLEGDEVPAPVGGRHVAPGVVVQINMHREMLIDETLIEINPVEDQTIEGRR